MGTGASASKKQHEQIAEASVDQLAADVAGLSKEERAALHEAADAGGDEATGITQEEAAKLKEAETLIEIRAALAKARSREFGTVSLKQDEIVSVSVGGCGTEVSLGFWQGVMNESQLDDRGLYTGDEREVHLERSGVFFREVQDTYRPRAVFVDTDPGTAAIGKKSPVGPVLGNYVCGVKGVGNNFAKGYYGDGADLAERAIDAVRKELERCECPQGLQLFHGLGGGTGSGMGGLLLEKLKDEHASLVLSTVSVFPSPKVSDTVVEPYNAVLASHKLLEHAHTTCVVDNEALHNMSHNVLKINEPKYVDLNHLIRMTLMGYSAPFRFKSSQIDDLRKQYDRLVAFPRLKFLVMSHAPLFPQDVTSHPLVDVEELMRQVLSDRNFFANIKSDDGKYIAAAFNFRGKDNFLAQTDVLKEEASPCASDWVGWEDWRSHNVISNYLYQRPPDTPQSMTMVANSTAMKGVFQRHATQFGAMYRRRAFLHWYRGEGMEEKEFEDADQHVRDLIYEYQDFQDAKLVNGSAG